MMIATNHVPDGTPSPLAQAMRQHLTADRRSPRFDATLHCCIEILWSAAQGSARIAALFTEHHP